jgi:hypothetical protein
MEFFVRQHGRGLRSWFVEDGACNRLSGPLTTDEAQRLRVSRQMDEQAQRDRDPTVRRQRRTKAAYRQFARSPFLQVVKQIHLQARRLLPSPGELRRANKLGQQGVAIWDEYRELRRQGTGIHPSEWLDVYDRRKRALQTKAATRANPNRQKGKSTREQVAKQWAALALPEHNRASLIARKLRIDVRHVRRIADELGLRNKNRTCRRNRSSL